jgi:hypothetical protein
MVPDMKLFGVSDGMGPHRTGRHLKGEISDLVWRIALVVFAVYVLAHGIFL